MTLCHSWVIKRTARYDTAAAAVGPEGGSREHGIGDMLNRVIYGAFCVPYKLDTGFGATSALKQASWPRTARRSSRPCRRCIP